jgi:monofunctional biosynthetic peptidoglycan transglycosylase
MKRTTKQKRKKAKRRLRKRRLMRRIGVAICIALFVPVYMVILFRFVDPSAGVYMASEGYRLGGIKHEWVSLDEIADAMPRSAVAAEDANFCMHNGFDIEAIREAIEGGGARGGSTISQQVAKNVFLWHGRTYLRKGLEAGFTILIELFWSKERIIEVYLNVAEFDGGVFGVKAAARHYFGVSPAKLTATQSARLAAILPNPKGRSASRPSNRVRKRTRAIISGAGTIHADGRADCFQGG